MSGKGKLDKGVYIGLAVLGVFLIVGILASKFM